MAEGGGEGGPQELHGADGRTFSLTGESVRLGGKGRFGSIPVREVASCHFERGAWTIGQAALVLVGSFLAVGFVMSAIDEPGWFTLFLLALALTVAVFTASRRGGPRTLTIRSRGGGVLSLRPAKEQEEQVLAFVDALERLKREAMSGGAAPGAPSFEPYLRRRSP